MVEVAESGRHGAAGKAARTLVDMWGSRHSTFKHDDAPSFCARPECVGSLRDLGQCYDCGFCVCGKKRPPPLVQPLVWFIKGQVVKGCPHKAVYEACALVVQVSSDSDESLFFHVGFGNLNSLKFTVMPLTLHVLGDSDAVVLRAESLEVCRLAELLRYYDLDARWHVELLRIDTSSTSMLEPFVPNIVLARSLDVKERAFRFVCLFD